MYGMGFPGGSIIKNSPANVGDTEDAESIRVITIPWRRRATHFSVLAWKSPWTEEPGGLQSMG